MKANCALIIPRVGRLAAFQLSGLFVCSEKSLFAYTIPRACFLVGLPKLQGSLFPEPPTRSNSPLT